MEVMWRMPRQRSRALSAGRPRRHRSYRGLGAAALMRPARRGHRSQADAARTRPPSPPKLVRAAQPLPLNRPAAISMCHGSSP